MKLATGLLKRICPELLKPVMLFFVMSLLLVILGFYAGVQANSMQIRSGVLDYREDLIEVSEGVTVFWDEYQVDSNRAEIEREDEIARFFTDVKLSFADGTVDSEEMTAYLADDRFVFERQVLMIYQRQGEDEDEETEEPMELRTDNLELFGETGNFQARGNVEIDYRGRNMTADEGDYDAEEEIFYLRDNVVMEEPDGDRIRSNRAEVHLGAEDVFRAEGDVEIEMDI